MRTARPILAPTVGALTIALLSIVGPTPRAAAAPAPWTWTRVVTPVAVEPHGYYSIRSFCPAGYTAITGGLELPQSSTVITNAQYRLDDGDGSSWFVALENTSSASGSAKVVAECALTSQLPGISYNSAEFSVNGSGVADGTVGCANAGEVVLTGGADWDNVNSRWIDLSGPTWNGEGWHAHGSNSVGSARLTVEVYCVDPGQVPGFERVEAAQGSTYNWQESATCPAGKRILNGGSDVRGVFASYPTISKWTATGQYPHPEAVIRAWCVDAGTPTIAITSATPGPHGATTRDDFAVFTMNGSDPAGMPNGFRCSVDGGALTACGGSILYPGLEDGPHHFGVFNQTADGRTSGLATYDWTSDATAPAVIAPALPRVSLADPVTARWSATDQYAGIAGYRAQYWRARADGTTTGWRQPPGWGALTSPSVRLPALAAGDSICVSVRAFDAVGNLSDWTAPACTSRPFDDRALTGANWTRESGAQYWQGTATRTSTIPRTLTRAGVRLSRVGVVATVCSACGPVDLYVGATRIGRISLTRTTTKHQQVLLLPAFTERTGDVVLRSVTSGKTVRIDGLVTIRTTTAPPSVQRRSRFHPAGRAR